MPSRPVASLALASILVLTGCATAPPRPANDVKLASFETDDAPKPEFPGEAAAYWAALHRTPKGQSPAMLNLRARDEVRRQALSAAAANLRIREWGPGNFGGRLRGLVVHPGDPDTILIGAVDGGVWKSTDGGASWGPSDDFLPSLAVGSMIIDPDDSSRVFVGTGEGFFNGDAARGAGIFVSTDFGDTWAQLPATANSDFHYVNRLAMIPGTDTLVAATRTGLWRSTDLGVSWGLVQAATTETGSRGFVDVKIDPANPVRLYAYHFSGNGNTGARHVWRSGNSGAAWSELGAAEGIPETDIRRMEIGVGSDGVVYLCVSNAADATRGLWRSPQGGNAFAQTASATPFIERQGWYDLICAVDPNDSDTVYMGAVDLYETTDAGATITRKSFWNPGAGQMPQYVHADLHVVAFHPTRADTFWVGCDGGVFRTDDGAETFVELNNDLRITQYYGIYPHPQGLAVNGGTQDNGSHLFFGDREVWLQWFGGDGGYAAWDAQDPSFLYGSLPFAGMFGSPDGGATSAQMTLPNTTGSLFIQPFTLDPSNGNRMIIGTDNVFFSSNARLIDGATFTDVSGSLGGSVSATTISPHDGQVAYAGTTNGGVFTTATLSIPSTWTQLGSGTLPTDGQVTSIEVDPHDATGNTLYVTYGSYAADRVWKSIDGGASWTSIQDILPQIPMFWLRVDPTDASTLWLGSELGLWVSWQGGPWLHYEYGTAWSRVVQLHWTGEDTLWIGTHGRSIYRADRSPASVALGAIDDSECDGDGILDLGETVQLPLSITNEGGFDMGSVTVTPSSSYPGLDVDPTPVNLPTIPVGATEGFTVEVTLDDLADCPDVAGLVLDIEFSDAVGTRTVSNTLEIPVGADEVVESGTLTDGAESADTPLTSTAAVGEDDWARVTTQANSGSRSWFAADVESYADKSLMTPWMDVGGGSTQIDFSLFYDMEGDGTQLWDGAVLEMRTADAPEDWIDIGVLSTVPYDGELFNNNTAPRRLAWSGTQTSWRDATVDLGPTVNGEQVQIRFRVICDTLAANVGFWVDDISVTNVTWVDATTCDDSFCGEIFIDGFESGDTTAWDATVGD